MCWEKLSKIKQKDGCTFIQYLPRVLSNSLTLGLFSHLRDDMVLTTGYGPISEAAY